MYRHPSPIITSFNEEFLNELLPKIGNEKSSKCLIMGDLNADLLKMIHPVIYARSDIIFWIQATYFATN